VCCGGAARDTYLGRKPKDYDFVIIDRHDGIDYMAAISEATGFVCRELGDDEEYVADDRGLDHVYESYLHTGELGGQLTVQFLLYSRSKTKSFKGDPYNVVEDFDCSLNYAWFEEYQGKLLVRVHPEFPSLQFDMPVRHRDGDENRRNYIRAKFPEFY